MDSAIKSRNDGSVDSGVSDYVIPWLVEDPDAVFGACRAEACQSEGGPVAPKLVRAKAEPRNLQPVSFT